MNHRFSILTLIILLSTMITSAQTKTSEGSAKKEITKFPKVNFTECLQAISDHSAEFKGRIFPIDPDGWSFVVSDEQRMESTVYLPNGNVFQLKPTRPLKAEFMGPYSCQEVTKSTNEVAMGAAAIFGFYEKAMQDTKGTSLESRKLIKEKCSLVASYGNKGGGGMMGMMMSAPPHGGMMGMPPGGFPPPPDKKSNSAR